MSFLNDRGAALLHEGLPSQNGENRVAALPLAGFRILILEDEYLIAMDVEQLCRDHGAEDTVLIRDLDGIDETVAGERFDAAVIDAMLGGCSTLDFARTLKERKVPFVFATGYDDAAERFADFPGVPVVGKPYSGKELIEAIVRAASRGADQATLEPST
jgi:DNA-binding response OmpR family regulator